MIFYYPIEGNYMPEAGVGFGHLFQKVTSVS